MGLKIKIVAVSLVMAGCAWGCSGFLLSLLLSAADTKIGVLPAGTAPDSVDFSASELKSLS